MLNELYLLSVVLERLGIVPHQWHKDLKPLPNATARKPCFRLVVGPDGAIVDIAPMDHGLVHTLRKWEPSNGNSFPGFNIQPLYRTLSEAHKRQLKKWRDGKEIDSDIIRKWCTEELIKNWDDKFWKKMSKCLGDIPQELNRRCANASISNGALQQLCERVNILRNGGPDEFLRALESRIIALLESGQHVQALLPMLIHEGSPKKKPEDDRGAVSVFMDLSDWKEYPVAHEESVKHINEALIFSANPSEKEKANASMDAFGLDCIRTEEKLPEVKLPTLGGVKLRAMNSESPCQHRYGTIDAVSFRIGRDSRKRVKGALEWLKADEREGATWGRADKKELIFAYPTVLPKVSLKLVAALGAGKINDTEARFENCAKDVVTCLKGLAPRLKDIELRVFSLRKMDKARTKVVFHRNYSAQRLADAAQEWSQGCHNIPTICIKTWGKEKGVRVIAAPEVPFPLQIAECLNRIWKQDGTSKDEIQAVSKSVGIELLLDESSSLRLVPHLLSLALQNGQGLFHSLGHSQHRGEAINLDRYNRHKQLMPAILGLMLWKSGIGKEAYMNNPSYLVGKMLKLADELHALYCREVRKNNLPPQLIGNALMVAALDSPTRALAQLALRITPYLGWARTNTADTAGLSRYFLKEFGIIEAELRNAALPNRLGDAERAQLLLGYVSGNAQTGKTTDSIND